MSLLALDARWRRFNDEARTCPCCGRRFSGIYDLGFDHPSDWSHDARGDAPFVKEGEDQLSPDLCRHGDNRYLRAVLSMPVQGAEESILITPWVQVSPEIFYGYLETWDDPSAPLPPSAEAILANDLPGLAAAGSLMTAAFPNRDARPILSFRDSTLNQPMTQGISFDRLLDLYAAFGDDIRPHLLRD
ncbi:DUF2199 domain-containing protein [Thalassovita sp.]|uniref:DUF2199 domain-containing protein n=1 Tax=Thalassovita sp. TaxID=1979401 RepID=UPI0029DE7A25|nr:DUF2199 domain-containing protein [Thalassovita sp.]